MRGNEWYILRVLTLLRRRRVLTLLPRLRVLTRLCRCQVGAMGA